MVNRSAALGGVALCLALVVSTTGCGGASRSEPTKPPGGAVQARASLVQQRTDEGTRRVDVRVTNTGDGDFTVTTVRLDWSGTKPLPDTPKDTDFAPGQVVDLRTAYGSPRCAADVSSAPQAVLTIDGRVARLDLDRDGEAWLRRLFDRECALRRLARTAHLELGRSYRPVTSGGEPYLQGTIRAERPASGTGDPLTVKALLGSVLLSFRASPDTPLPWTLPPGDDTADWPVLFGSSNRCDAHARGESKQTFLLNVYVAVPGQPVQRVILTPGRAAQVRMLEVVDRVCAGSR